MNNKATDNDVKEIVRESTKFCNVSSSRSSDCHEAAQFVIKRNPPDKRAGMMKVGTWTVRSFNTEGRLENTLIEMKRSKIAIMGICETHWKECCDFVTDGYRVIGSGGAMKRNGVAIILDLSLSGEVLHIDCTNERVMAIKVKAEPVDTLFIQVYLPTSTAEEDEAEHIYELIEDILKKKIKESTILLS